MIEEMHEHLQRSSAFWKQALEHYKLGETEKATELAWGSATQAIMALALARRKKLGGGHREIKQYLKAVASELEDEELDDLFARAEAAHANFYRDFMDGEEVRKVLAQMGRLLEKVHRLMPPQG